MKVLLSGDTNYREQLASASPGGRSSTDDDQGEAASDDEERNTSGSVYTPPSGEDESSSATPPSQARSIVSQGDAEYRTWAEDLWRPVQEEWLAQYNEPLPALMQGKELMKIARKTPERLCEAGRWSQNPLVLMEHLQIQQIKDWMEPYWIQHCLRCLDEATELVMDSTIRPALDDWAASIRAAPSSRVSNELLHNASAWKMLEEYAPGTTAGPTADPIFTLKYKQLNAFILVLDQLFPDLAWRILHAAKWEGELEGVTLVTAYAQNEGFRATLRPWPRYRPDTKGIPIASRQDESHDDPPREVNYASWIHGFFDRAQRRALPKLARYPVDATVGILTQNVRGFKGQHDNQELWMNGWKQKMNGKRIVCIAVQELHVASYKEVAQLEEKWCRMWGIKPDPLQRLTFCTVTPAKARGVGFLLHPSLRTDGFKASEYHVQDGRLLVITSATTRYVNVYAPNSATKREKFFEGIPERLQKEDKVTYCVGDFNCVMDASQDRVRQGKWGTTRCESPTLGRFIHDWTLVDAIDQHREKTAPINHLTYWQGTTGARLDRIYVSAKHKAWVIDVEVVTPAAHSDHSGVIAWVRNPLTRSIKRVLQPTPYPIRGRDPDIIERNIGVEVCRILERAQADHLGMDEAVNLFVQRLQQVQKDERRRAKRQQRRRDQRARRQIQTLSDLIDYIQGRVQRQRRQSHHTTILHRSGNSAHLFKRLVRMDQRRLIPQIQRQTGTEETDDRPVADVLAAELHHIFGTRHATVPTDEMRDVCNQLYSIPEEHQLTAGDQDLLMGDITEEEVVQALKHLGRHKAAGPDRLNNDFYKDWGTLLAPWLAATFTHMVRGQPPPTTFSEALIIPVPKAGDPTLATNYRPVSLLQSSYKIFTKILAERVQRSLGKIINQDQNGFVRGRSLDDNVHMMQAILNQAANADEPTGAIVLVDFQKAYDSVDRNFLWMAMEDFGYPQGFIQLVQTLHINTRARIVANGEVSEEFDIVSGIRQGCPLAPLPFLLAAETLKYALQADDSIHGITIHGMIGQHVHTLSAFVDDSAVFLESTTMVAALEDVLRKFGAVSGLRAQPHKSHALILDPYFSGTHLGQFPVVPHGHTVPYLGVEIGIGDLTAANWTKRINKLQTRLGMLSRYTTGVSDRVQVINISATPSILFTARFFPPPASVQTQIDSIWRQYIWKGTIRQEEVRAHKLAREVMELPKRLGGVGLRDYRGATLVQAATALIFPSHAHQRCSPMTGAAQTRTSALQLINAVLGRTYAHPEHLTINKTSLLSTWTTPWAGIQWTSTRSGIFQVPKELMPQLTATQTATYAAMPAEIRTFWEYFPWRHNTWIRESNGTTMGGRIYNNIRPQTLKELQLVELGPGLCRFANPLNDPFRLKRQSLQKLGRWLSVIVSNLPRLAMDEHQDTARVYATGPNPTFDKYEWVARPDHTLEGLLLTMKWEDESTTQPKATIRAHYHGWARPLSFIAIGTDEETERDMERLKNGPPVLLAGHPQFQSAPTMLPILTSVPAQHHALRRLTRTLIKPATERTEIGLSKLDQRLDRQQRQNPEISGHLQGISLQALTHRRWGVTEYQRFFWYRLVLGALNLRDQEGRKMECPHFFCDDKGEYNLDHVFWKCRGARRFWNELLERWTGAPVEAEEAKAYVFTRRSPRPRDDLIQTLQLNDEPLASRSTPLEHLWSVICTTVMQTIWLLRNTGAFHEAHYAPNQYSNSLWAAAEKQLDAVYLYPDPEIEGSFTHRTILIYWSQLRTTAPRTQEVHREVRLYFDGGARGNPGEAGSGCVILERQPSEAEWKLT